mmetsp:Transcript_34552/g.86189  ORF Transcript_34552/g.86189 Transcript_34552/m.86189 type:complete len:230 (-) Transcript_34552:622-1311(-)
MPTSSSHTPLRGMRCAAAERARGLAARLPFCFTARPSPAAALPPPAATAGDGASPPSSPPAPRAAASSSAVAPRLVEWPSFHPDFVQRSGTVSVGMLRREPHAPSSSSPSPSASPASAMSARVSQRSPLCLSTTEAGVGGLRLLYGGSESSPSSSPPSAMAAAGVRAPPFFLPPVLLLPRGSAPTRGGTERAGGVCAALPPALALPPLLTRASGLSCGASITHLPATPP